MELLCGVCVEMLPSDVSQHVVIIFLISEVANVTAADYFGIPLIPFLFWIFIESKLGWF